MSNGPKFILPNQKGTELWPQQMQQPPKLVIPGTEHDPALRQQVIADFAGRLGNFHAKSAQMHALSGNAITKQTLAHPDGTLTYTNIQGHETLQLDVHPEKPGGRHYWDWALVDLTITGQFGDFAAFARMPAVTPPPAGAVMPYPRVAHDVYAPAEWPVEFIAYPDQRTPLAMVTTDNRQTASLRIDLRPFRDWSAVEVDLYGALAQTGSHENIFNGGEATITRWGRHNFTSGQYGAVVLSPTQFLQQDLFRRYFPATAGSEYRSSSTPGDAANDGAFTWTNYWNGSAWANPSLDPSVTYPLFPAFDETQHYPDGSLKQVKHVSWGMQNPDGSGGSTAPYPPVIIGDYLFGADDYIYMYGPTFTVVNVADPPTTVPGEVRGVLLNDPVDWGYVQRNGTDTIYFTWEVADKYPLRPSQLLLKSAAVSTQTDAQAADTSLANHFGLNWLGTITVDLIHGGISFKPA